MSKEDKVGIWLADAELCYHTALGGGPLEPRPLCVMRVSRQVKFLMWKIV